MLSPSLSACAVGAVANSPFVCQLLFTLIAHCIVPLFLCISFILPSNLLTLTPFFFAIGSHCVIQAGLKLAIILTKSLECRDYRYVPACG
jgi:hypothetical protein